MKTPSNEEFKISGDELLAKVKELIKKGKARKIIIKNNQGDSLLEIPLNVGVAVGTAGIILAPILAAVGALAALVTKVTVVVVKNEE